MFIITYKNSEGNAIKITFFFKILIYFYRFLVSWDIPGYNSTENRMSSWFQMKDRESPTCQRLISRKPIRIPLEPYFADL